MDSPGGGKDFVVDEDSVIWALNEEDGISVWKQSELEKRFITDPVFFDNYIVVGDFEDMSIGYPLRQVKS